VTSLCEVLQGKTEVYFCKECAHLQTTELENLGEYYDQTYKILIDSEDEDQLYEVAGDRKTFRFDHQVDTLLSKVELPRGARILDYGCAKSTTLKLLSRKRPDVVPYLFDVSEMYVPFWERFAAPDNWATYQPKADWRGRFDVVTSFFAFEHVSDPRDELATINALLKDEGVFYCIVPNVYANTADFVVVDHVHHYSPLSFRRLLDDAGFSAVEVDEKAHHSALVITASKMRKQVETLANAGSDGVAPFSACVSEMASYWSDFAQNVQAFERKHAVAKKAAIYGSGFYGTFIATCLNNLGKIACFIDRNPYRQGKTLLERPIRDPANLPADVEIIYVGLNPLRARDEIDKVELWRNKTLTYFYP